jgi:LmbE family N-acetylglucosaminyl deacetylase
MSFTLVAFHAHPDDEAIATAGTMARAKADGHRVVLVLATRGELGQHDPAILDAGETITDRRVSEVTEAAKILGVDRLEFLGYRDSGMVGESTNTDANAFAAADVEEAASRLARILSEERADVLTVYDDHGVYGHPDHVQVHAVGVRAAELAGNVRVVESTMNRDFLLQLMAENADTMSDVPDRPDPADFQEFGSPAEIITTKVDVRDFVELKRAAMAAHASQIPADSFFMQMPLDAFREAFGYEWFIRRGAEPGIREASVFEGLS